MRQTDKTGVIEGFYDGFGRAAPKPGDISDAFINLPTKLTEPGSRPVYVVHEIRVIYGQTRRRVLGVYDSERDAEQQAADARRLLVRFLEQHDGRPFQDEMCGGTLVQYWHAGNPLRIVGFKVWVESVR